MQPKLEYFKSDLYKIDILKAHIENCIYNGNRLENNEEVLINFKKLYHSLDSESSINNIMIRLIKLEKDIVKQISNNNSNDILKYLLSLIINEKLNLLHDNKKVIEEILELSEQTMSSENQELKTAISIVLEEFINDEPEYETIKDKLENAIVTVKGYDRALKMMKRYETYDEVIVNPELKKLINNLQIIFDSNYMYF